MLNILPEAQLPHIKSTPLYILPSFLCLQLNYTSTRTRRLPGTQQMSTKVTFPAAEPDAKKQQSLTLNPNLTGWFGFVKAASGASLRPN